MKKTTILTLSFVIIFLLGFYLQYFIAKQTNKNNDKNKPDNNNQINTKNNMKLGAFSVSLSVKDIQVSKQFYENLGFTVFAGGLDKNYLIMKNENSLIGLFQGMFQGNILTFNPGWDENAQNIEKFDDVRVIQQQLKDKGVKLTSEADEKTTGPASVMLTDPDGNLIYIDQHR